MFSRSLAIVAILTLSTAASAADLVISEPDPVMVESYGPSIYVQLLGGVVAGGDLGIPEATPPFDHWDIDPGYALAGTIGVVVMDGLSVEADVLYTKRMYSEDPVYIVEDDYWTSTSVMGNLKYTLNVTEGIDL